MPIKVAAAAYPIEWLTSWNQYQDKLTSWVKEAAMEGADLLVFPEYGAMELASLAGKEIAGDLANSLRAVSEFAQQANDLQARLAQQFGCYILAASTPFQSDQNKAVNRARLFAPNGESLYQDKQIMTRFEREEWGISSGDPLQVIDTPIGKLGVLICYDVEFPLFARALSDCDILLVPSCTDSLSGYWRVRIGAMARALEQQCVCVMSSVIGEAHWSPALDESFGAAGVFCPPDKGLPENGVLALGEMNVAGWTYADIDLNSLKEVRADGQVLNHRDWDDQIPRHSQVIKRQLD